jgi:hypothetical protein
MIRCTKNQATKCRLYAPAHECGAAIGHRGLGAAASEAKFAVVLDQGMPQNRRCAGNQAFSLAWQVVQRDGFAEDCRPMRWPIMRSNT